MGRSKKKVISQYEYLGYTFLQKAYSYELFIYAPDGRIMYSQRQDKPLTTKQCKKLLHEITGRGVYDEKEDKVVYPYGVQDYANGVYKPTKKVG